MKLKKINFNQPNLKDKTQVDCKFWETVMNNENDGYDYVIELKMCFILECNQFYENCEQG